MPLRNATVTQDRELDNAVQAVSSVLDIVKDLDGRLDEWAAAAALLGCASPDELRDKASELDGNLV